MAHSSHRNPDASRPFSHDRLTMLPREAGVSAALLVTSALQHLSPEEMVAGVNMATAAINNRLGLDPQSMHTMAMRLLTNQQFHTKTDNALQSLRDFAGLRIAGQDVTYG